MRLVKISNEFFDKCRENNVHKELMFNEDGRPSVLIVKLKYKEQYHKFCCTPSFKYITQNAKKSIFFIAAKSQNKTSSFAWNTLY